MGLKCVIMKWENILFSHNIKTTDKCGETHLSFHYSATCCWETGSRNSCECSSDTNLPLRGGPMRPPFQNFKDLLQSFWCHIPHFTYRFFCLFLFFVSSLIRSDLAAQEESK